MQLQTSPSTTDGSEHAKHSPARPAPLCNHILSTGNRCRGMALRGQRFCRAHSQNRRAYEREQTLFRMLDRLRDQIGEMSTAELLYFLYQKLNRLQKTMRRYPDVNYTLAAALERIDEITRKESAAKQQLQQNHMLLEQIRAFQINSATCAQARPNQ